MRYFVRMHGYISGGRITTITVRTPRWRTEPRQSFAATCSGGKDDGEAALEKAARFPLSRRTMTAANLSKKNYPSTQLLEALS
jgi:hypothetical protein